MPSLEPNRLPRFAASLPPDTRVGLYAKRGRKSVDKVQSTHFRSLAELGRASEVLSGSCTISRLWSHAGGHRYSCEAMPSA